MWHKLQGKTTHWEWIGVNNKSRSTESSCIFKMEPQKRISFCFFVCLFVFLQQSNAYQLSGPNSSEILVSYSFTSSAGPDNLI